MSDDSSDLAEIKISSKSSLDDLDRRESVWTTRNEVLLKQWVNDCLKRDKKHATKSKRFKKLHIGLSIPTICLPIISAAVSGVVPIDSIVTTVLLSTSGILTGINTFMSFEKKQQIHNEYSGRYLVLATQIEKELSKKKSERPPVDVYLSDISHQYNNLCLSAPDL